jgi:integrase
VAWLYKQRGSSNWWLGYRANGKQMLRSTGTPDRAKAERELAKVRSMFEAHRANALTKELYEALTGRAAPSVLLSAELDDWLAEAGKSTSASTAASYRKVAEEFAAFLNATEAGMALADVAPEHVRGYLAAVRARSSASTANVRRKILSVFFSRCLAGELLDRNPCVAVKRFRDVQGEKVARRSFTLDEVRLLHRKAADDFWRYAVEGGFSTGLRLGDLATLSRGALDLEERVLRVKTRKTGKTVTIPLHHGFAGRLRERLRELGPGPAADYLWPEQARLYLAQGPGALSNKFHALLVVCGLAKARTHKKTAGKHGRGGRRLGIEVSFHCFRHTFVSMLKIGGGSQAVAKELAGHSSNAVSDNYTHLPLETLRGAVAGLPEVVV